MFKVVAAFFCGFGSYLLLSTYLSPLRSIVFHLGTFGVSIALCCACVLTVATFKAIK